MTRIDACCLKSILLRILRWLLWCLADFPSLEHWEWVAVPPVYIGPTPRPGRNTTQRITFLTLEGTFHHRFYPLYNPGMKLTFAQNLPLRTYIIDSSNQILYQVSTPHSGSFTTIARNYSATPTSDVASEHTLVESQWCQLARLCWIKPESSQIHIPALAQCQNNFNSISRWRIIKHLPSIDCLHQAGSVT